QSLDQAKKEFAGFVGSSMLGDANVTGVIGARARRGPLAIPDPSVAVLDSHMSDADWDVHFSVPCPMPDNFSAAISLGYLSGVRSHDVRSPMPYGSLTKPKVVDLDGDGFVRDWEVQAVREAAGAGKKGGVLDCDGDGEVTAGDVQMAIEQMDLYVA